MIRCLSKCTDLEYQDKERMMNLTFKKFSYRSELREITISQYVKIVLNMRFHQMSCLHIGKQLNFHMR